MSKTLWINSVMLMLWGGAATVAQEIRPLDGLTLSADSPQVAAPGKYWLGIQVFPVPEAVRDQLQLPEKQGLLVAAVVPDSPAAKAGIVKHDVLLRAGEKPLVEPRELVQVVETAKEAKLKIELIHGGKPKTVEATPAKRPKEILGQPGAAQPGDWETMQKWLERMYSGEPGAERPPMRFRLFHPGAIVPGEAFTPAPLPPDMSIIISKEGDQPAKIVVKQGDKKTEVTEKELDKLPADVRQHVERMLGRGSFGILGGSPSVDILPEMKTPGESATGPETKSGRGANLLDRIERRFDEMNRRMDRLLQAIESATDGQGHPSAAKPTEKK